MNRLIQSISQRLPWIKKVFNRYFFALMFCTYCITSLKIFNKIYDTSKMIIDEEFHIPQGEAYCNLNFTKYNEKITTFPGLYLLSTMILAPFGVCSAYYLRFLNLIAGALNFILFYIMAKFMFIHHDIAEFNVVLTAFNMATLPPLYFFSHVYYTDVFSVTFVVGMMILFYSRSHVLAAVFGAFAVLMRQTNVVWVAMFGGMYFIREATLVIKIGRKNQSGDNSIMPNRNLTLEDILDFMDHYENRKIMLGNLKMKVYMNTLAYASVVIGFIIFVIANGSIVLGDKSAHQATLHLPQLLYFSLFFCLFGWAFLTAILHKFVRYMVRNYLQASYFLVLFMLIAYYNTIEHEYLLADNRHFTFYVWHRFYKRHDYFRYIMCVPYLFGFYTLIRRLRPSRDLSFIIFYFPALFANLCFQRMIEVRYFLLPYLIARFHFKEVATVSLVVEAATFTVYNYLTLDLFFNKDVIWENFPDAQKIIW